MATKLYLKVARKFKALKQERTHLTDAMYEKELKNLLIELQQDLKDPTLSKEESLQLSHLLQLIHS